MMPWNIWKSNDSSHLQMTNNDRKEEGIKKWKRKLEWLYGC